MRWLRLLRDALIGPPAKPLDTADIWKAHEEFLLSQHEFNRRLQEMEDAKPGPKSLYDSRPEAPPPDHAAFERGFNHSVASIARRIEQRRKP
jgi:hypothetical protein